MAKKRKNKPDFFLLVIVCLLVLWGIFAVCLVSLPLSQQRFATPWHYLQNQLIKVGIGLAAGIILYKLSPKILKKISLFLFIACLLLTALVFAPKIGVSVAGGRRWISLAGFLLQPSEFLKISFIVYLAAWLGKSKQISPEKKIKEILAPFIVVSSLVFALLSAQPDMSTLAILIVVALAMYFASYTPLWHTFAMLGAGAGAIVITAFIRTYSLKRWLIFLNPTADPLGHGFQLRQSLIAIGSGKLAGVGEGFGLGLGSYGAELLPTPFTDSIFAIIGKGWGFIGGVALTALFVLFLWRCLREAKTLGFAFEGLIVLGVGIWITFQAFFNIGGMLGILPMGGVPLPFISYGGSHIIAEIAAAGLILNISRLKNNV